MSLLRKFIFRIDFQKPMKSYISKRKIGEGTYATVYLASVTAQAATKLVTCGEKTDHPDVAIKKIKKNKHIHGFDISAYREIISLKRVSSKYVISLIDTFEYDTDIHLVLEYADTDLEAIIRNKDLVILPADIKAWMGMITRGLAKIHEMYIIHRDLKPNNILITREGIVKIADFGMARPISNNMSVQVVTRWYRPPEILMGSKNYGFGADMWSLGCIFAELLLRVPLFAGETDIEQLGLIVKVFGSPTEESWPGLKTLPGYLEFNKQPKIPLESIFTAASSDALDLLKKMLDYNPVKRISCKGALDHIYFNNSPKPTDPKNLPFPEKK